MSRSWRPILGVVIALVLGAITGFLAGDWIRDLSVVSKLLIQLIKALATPLVFFATAEAILTHHVERKDFLRLLALVLTNAGIAILLGLFMADVFHPGDHLLFLKDRLGEAKTIAQPDIVELLKKQVPTSLVSPFAENDVLGVVVFAALIGFALRRVEGETKKSGAADAAARLSILARLPLLATLGRELSEITLGWVVRLVPLVVFAAAAQITHDHGLAPFGGLGRYVGLCLLGMLIHATFTYSAWLIFVARVNLLKFYRAALTPILYAMGVNSSLVALPHSLRALDELGVPRKAATLTTCIGTNLNNDGIILYEGFTLLALAQAFGLELSFGAQLVAALSCVLAAMGVAGIPEAGVVALTLVLSSFGLPAEALALLLSVDWIIARGRSMLNVTSDLVGATVLARFMTTDGSGPGPSEAVSAPA